MKFKQLLLDLLCKRKYSYKEIKGLAYDLIGQCEITLEEAYELINEMFDDGDIYEVAKGKFMASKALGLKKGTFCGSSKEFGFCQTEDDDEDIFLPPNATGGAYNRDTVLVKLNPNSQGKNRDGRVVKILSRGSTQVVGTYHYYKNHGIVYPDDKRFGHNIFIMRGDNLRAKEGDKVVVSVTKFGSKADVYGKVIELIGDINIKGNDVLSIIRNYKLYEEFPDNVLSFARTIPSKVTDKEMNGRRDLRSLRTFTIDGEDAKDFDDAVSIEKNADGTVKLGVHIADVSHYVTQDSVLDKEAFERGTSVYFPDRVLPMLPVELSNGICSLNPDVDRLTLTVFMDLDINANVVRHEICESVIYSCHRLTYTQVQKVLDGDEEQRARISDVADDLVLMAEYAKKMEDNRVARGALDFNIPETFVEIDENGKTIGIRARERYAAHRLIESFMVICNEVVAEEMCNKNLPFVYRVHEKPAIDRMTNFIGFIESLGVSVDIDLMKITPKQLQQVLDSVKDLPYQKVINTVMLRSLKKARYHQECLGHFGLASEFYCHFTSPIRRYPDLIIHRIIRLMLHNKIGGSRDFMDNYVAKSSLQSSERERLADEAERAVDDLKKAEYLQSHIGEEFEGVISGVAEKGLFVELDNTCEGFVRLDNLPQDYYLCDDKLYELNGKHNKFKLGEKVLIEVERVNLTERKVDFIYKKKIL